MAVSFKVPASPKKNIFVIDEFQGVDLTNTGANIDETRSPNAENMIRYVPGKVRKRMGYEKEILFGRDVNVNYAKGTSSSEQEVIIHPDEIDQFVQVYDLIQKIESKDGEQFNTYIDFDYKSEDSFYVNKVDDQNYVPASEEWSHASLIRVHSGTGRVSRIALLSSVSQTIIIKNFTICRAKDASYKWTPAPNYFVERETNDAIYGCHVLKTGTFEGNRVVNVNRALSTSSEFETFGITNEWTNIYNLAETPYPGRPLYIEFDYKLTGDDVTIAFAGVYNALNDLTPTDEPVHKSFSITPRQNAALRSTVRAICDNGTSAVLQIRNMSVCYQIDSETYDWSSAPEDRGKEFPYEDIYYVSSKNYATKDSFESETIASDGSAATATYIADATSCVKGFCHVEFDLHTSTYNPLISLQVNVSDNENFWWYRNTYTENLDSEHYDLFLYAGSTERYIDRIQLYFTVETGGAVWTSISNIKINEISPRTSYDISPNHYIYHVGNDLYLREANSGDFTKVYSGANRHLSKSWQFNKQLYILDGRDIYSYTDGAETVEPIGANNGYIPTVTFAKSPSGGGTAYEPLNMLQPGFYELFASEENSTIFHLSFRNLDSATVQAWVLDSNGNWVEKVERTDFTVNRGTGEVTFFHSPGVSPIRGEDNVKILAYRTVPGYRERVTKCTIGTLFGVGGAEDRLFLSGNPDYPNWDFYSERFDPTYFPDTGYSTLGSEASSIVGYALINNYLAAFKDGADLTQTVFIREGDLIPNEETGVSDPAFKLINTLQGNGVIAPYAFGNLQTEPVFLTKSGVFAITAQDITGEKYSQNRSFYLNGRLTKEHNLEDAVATIYNDMYVLAVNNQLYVLDGLQATRTDRAEPYATRQYVGFHCTDVPAICIWNDNALFFGTGDGKVCKFHTDVESLDSYNDDGEPIYCCWETPDLDGKLFYKNKTFRYFAIRMMKAIRTSVKLYSQKLGSWNFIKEDTSSGVVFDFENIDFELFSFSTDTSEKVVHTKVRVKKVDKARFRVENGNKNEPFGLFDLALEYIESGNYKG